MRMVAPSKVCRGFLSLRPGLFTGLLAGLFVFSSPAARAQNNLQYQQPPKSIVDIVEALPTPGVELSPAGGAVGKRWMLIERFSGLPTIAELAQPELRLAGLRFNPKTDGPSRGRYETSLELQALPNGKAMAVSGLPAHAKIRFADWSPDGRKISFVNISDAKEDAGLSLWIVDAATAGEAFAGNCAQRDFWFAV